MIIWHGFKTKIYILQCTLDTILSDVASVCKYITSKYAFMIHQKHIIIKYACCTMMVNWGIIISLYVSYCQDNLMVNVIQGTCDVF